MATITATEESVQNTRATWKGLCALARSLGYHDGRIQQLLNDDGSSASDFIEFVEDNPGVIEAICDWVLDNVELEEEDDPDEDGGEDDEEDEDEDERGKGG